MSVRNWAGNVTFEAARVHRPGSVEELREIVARAPRLHVLGARHSFADIADGPQLVALDGLPAGVEVDRKAGTASCAAGLTYGALAALLAPHGVALANLASLPHVTLAGAVATATHGSGDGNGNLATAVAGLEIVTSSGGLVSAARGDPDFDGLVVGLGATGVVTRVVLDVEPAYQVRQRVFEGMAWETLLAHFDAVMGAGSSVSIFTTWGGAVDAVWVKSRVTEAPEAFTDDLFGAPAATVERHPVPGFDPAGCTPQLGLRGPWSERLPHFLMSAVPSTGDELQSEYFVPRAQGPAAIEAVRSMSDRIRPLLRVSEIRTVAGDRLWLSPEQGRDTVCLHFTWRPDRAAVEALLADLEAALAPFQARPHWGKLFVASTPALYPRLPDFRRLVERMDPRGAFRNRWLEANVL
jgi:alditol oxidase